VATPFDLRWMESIDDEYDPRDLGDLKIEDLTDGDYDMQIMAASAKPLEAKAMLVLELKLEVLTPGKHAGQRYQFSWFIKDKDSAVRVSKDLKRLGFDTDLWTRANDRPFSVEIQKVPRVLRGLRFAAKKKTNTGNDGKTYHNLNINRRSLPDGKPEFLGPEQLDAPDLDADPF
jgi:hypothetical protein